MLRVKCPTGEKKQKAKKSSAKNPMVGEHTRRCSPVKVIDNKSHARVNGQKHRSKRNGKQPVKIKSAASMTRSVESWAGGGFQRSPSPRCLPLPTATLIQRASGSAQHSGRAS